ncbi:MAG: hypothetical protein K8F91_21590, partial [Candidatus Obscuribacterales bacterium]|nr:hypothetical protein [Candidatus Obscuribacterales bacterium]
MVKPASYHPQPSLRQLLATEAFAEARLICGEGHLDSPVSQVIAGLNNGSGDRSLLVLDGVAWTADCKQGALNGLDLSLLSGVVFITPSPSPLSNTKTAAKPSVAETEPDCGYGEILARARKIDLPFVVMPQYQDCDQILRDIKYAFACQSRRAVSRVQALLLNTVLDQGLEAMVGLLSELVASPVAVETIDFKLLAGSGMGSTPTTHRRRILDESKRLLKSCGDGAIESFLYPLKAGKRLVLPLVCNGGNLVGFMSVIVKADEDEETVLAYMQPAALAALVDLSQKVKSDLGVSAGSRGILRDLLSGAPVSPTEQERLERHFGFDLYDGFFVFAVEVFSEEGPVGAAINWPENPYV